ncbi:MAG: hypothetical protein WBB52_06525 [Acidimicrobiales bacterium]|jgi:hypothetical protein
MNYYCKDHDPVGAKKADSEPDDQRRCAGGTIPLDREGYIAAVGPMASLEDPDAFDRAMRSFDDD